MMKRKQLKRIAVISGVTVLILLLTACGKSEFGLSENTGKLMKITANNASKDAFFMVGSLEVSSGEQIEIASNLTRGSIRVEIVGTPEEQSIDKLPEFDTEPILTANLGNAEKVAGTVPAGSYLLRATCLEKATGTIEIEVKPAG